MATPRATQAAVLLSVLFFISRLIGLVQNVIINAMLELPQADAYWAAFALPEVVNYLVAGGALSITFIPIFTKLQQTGDEREAWRFFSTIATVMTGVLLLLLVLATLFADPLMAVIRRGYVDSPEIFNLMVAMTRVLLPAQIFFYIGGLLVGVLNANKRFGASGWTGAVYNGVAIVVALVLMKLGTGPMAFAWGILVGALVGNFLLPLIATLRAPREQRPHFTFALDLKSSHVRKYFLNAIPIMFGVSLPVVDQLVVGWFATYLPEGALTHLTLGSRVMVAAQGIVGMAASVAAFPYLSADAAKGNWQEFSKFLREGLRRLLFITIPLSTLLILLAHPIITLLAYGKFDNPVSINETSLAFAFYCVGLFAWTAQQLVARGFYAMQDTLTPTIIGSFLTIFFFIPLLILASRSGILGLAAATSLGGMTHFLAVVIALDRRLSRRPQSSPIRLEKLAGVTLRTICACIVMGVCGQIVSNILNSFGPTGKAGALLHIFIVSAVAITAFAFCAEKFAIPEWHWLTKKFLSRLKR